MVSPLTADQASIFTWGQTAILIGLCSHLLIWYQRVCGYQTRSSKQGTGWGEIVTLIAGHKRSLKLQQVGRHAKCNKIQLVKYDKREVLYVDLKKKNLPRAGMRKMWFSNSMG